MTFNSLAFLVFYPVVLLLYFVLPKRLRPITLLISSYFFYAYSQFDLLFLILGTTIVSYISAIVIEKSESAAIRKTLLTVTLLVSLGVLFFYKYFNFLFGSAVGIASLFGAELSSLELNLILPVGISFYTFQTLSYVIDVYREDIPAEKSFVFYALFVSFFPQLVAGPLERPQNLLPQLKAVSGKAPDSVTGECLEGYRFDKDNALKGAKHMMVGFFKKIVVADLISVYVNAIYNKPEGATAIGVIIATCLFAVQIYCDFSGYTDIAIGCARIMGIRLMKNFDHPYLSASVKEFWSRWHISLSSWFKDYLYIPLGGNRCKKWRHLMNILIVFLVSGLWHGAAWTFVVWGALHGIYQIIGSFTKPARNKLIGKLGLSEEAAVVLWSRRVVTFILVCFAWIFFRANSLSDAMLLISKLGDFSGGITGAAKTMGFDLVGILMTALSIGSLITLERLLVYEDKKDGSSYLVRGGAFIYFVWIIMLCWLFLLSKSMMSTFIYFRF